MLPQEGEPLRDQAMDLLARHRNAEIKFVVPDIFWAEFGNVLWKAVRIGRLSREDADSGMRMLLAANFPSMPSASLLTSAFNIANTYGRTVYDSLYVALAVIAKAEMITADERLANAMASHLPVKWL